MLAVLRSRPVAPRGLLVVLLVAGLSAVGADGRVARAGSSSACADDPTPTKAVIWPGNPYLAVAVRATPTTQAVTVCYSTGHENQTSFAGGVVHVLGGNSGTSTSPFAYASVLAMCWSDANTTGPDVICFTNPAVWMYQPTVQPVDQPGSNDVLYRVTWGFGICVVGCTAAGDTVEKTGTVVGTFAVTGGPTGTTGAGVTLQSTEVWFDGVLVDTIDGTSAKAGVSNTATPGTPGTAFTPFAGGPCVAGVCGPAYQAWVPGYSNGVVVQVGPTTHTQPVTLPTTGGGRLCVIDSDTGNCA